MNLDPASSDGARNLLLVKLVGGLVVAGIVLGLVVGVLGTTVLRSMGLKEQPPPPETSDAPVPAPTATQAGDEDQDDESSDEGDEDDEEADGRKNKQPTVMHARPNPAVPGGKVTLSGSFRNLHGGTLQVQRREGGTWTDFPVTATVNPNGTFSTYIITSRTGTSPYRLLHTQSGRSTPPVRITIG